MNGMVCERLNRGSAGVSRSAETRTAAPAIAVPPPQTPARLTRRQLVQKLARTIAAIDRRVNRQLNAILHHPELQRLEAAWRGLHYLVHEVQPGDNVKVRVLNVSWRELSRDLERALEFDQSQLFRKVYCEEFGTPGGEPFGVLVGDYEIRNRPDDLTALGRVAAVAAAAFCPFLAAAHASLLDLESFVELEQSLDLARTFQGQDHLKWRALRDAEDSRFLGLTLPRVLLRLPYADDNRRVDGFRFREEAGALDRSECLWGNAAFAFGVVLAREFAASGWFAGIRGFRRGEAGAGLLDDLPVPSFATDRRGVAPGYATEVLVSDVQDKELGDLGFIPLCHRPGTAAAAFHGNQSVQKPRVYDEEAATVNARLSAMMQYVLCVSRFAHYVKVQVRDKLGSFTGPDECAAFLSRWLQNYLCGNEDAGPELKARYPLRDARVEVKPRPDNPGVYVCVLHLQPHFQLDQLVTAVKLVTELAITGPTGR
jgi:type VI secretion system ImpC/EvpB family protein